MRRVTNRTLTVAVLWSLAGCSNAIKDEEQRYEIVKKDGSASKICAQGGKVAAAYLAAKDADGYRRARVITDIDCTFARNKERDMHPDDMIGPIYRK